jgi:hypothetical protein
MAAAFLRQAPGSCYKSSLAKASSGLSATILAAEKDFDSFCNQIRKSEEAMTTQLY